MVKLSDVRERRENTFTPIRIIEVGQSVYIAPWALFLDRNDDIWIWGDTVYWLVDDDASSLKITRTEKGFLLSLSNIDVDAEGYYREPDETDIKIAGWSE